MVHSSGRRRGLCRAYIAVGEGGAWVEGGVGSSVVSCTFQWEREWLVSSTVSGTFQWERRGLDRSSVVNSALWYIPVEEGGAWYEGISRATAGMIDYSGTWGTGLLSFVERLAIWR